MGKHHYQLLRRYIMGFTLFCFIVATTGMVLAGNRAFSIAWWDTVLIASLWALGRIIIWCWSSWELVRGGVTEKAHTRD